MYDYKELNEFADGLCNRGFAVEKIKLWRGQRIIALDENGNYVGDAVLHNGSYGCERNFIEIMGFGVNDEAVGFLTAEEALQYVDRYLGRK